jgi:uncharacterized protein YbaR (Trm112 family)
MGEEGIPVVLPNTALNTSPKACPYTRGMESFESRSFSDITSSLHIILGG